MQQQSLPLLSAAPEEPPDIFLTLVSEWYGIHQPNWRRLFHVKGQAFENLWTTLWFAKGQLTVPLDERLRLKYLSAFQTVEPYCVLGAPAPPVTLPPLLAKIWTVGVVILCDQI